MSTNETLQQLDVLIHLSSLEAKGELLFSAVVLQYDLAAVGETPKEAVENVLQLVIDCCRDAAEFGINPRCLAATPYLQAFALGVPMQNGRFAENIDARLSEDVHEYLHCKEFNIRSVVDAQKAPDTW